MKFIYFPSLLGLIMASMGLKAQNNLNPGQLRVDATFQHLSINYAFSGDDNLNSTLTISHRKAGSTDPFQTSSKIMRAHPGMQVDGSPLNLNFLAGSVMFLLPGNAYELQIEIKDPDGGNSSQTLTVQTKSAPGPSSNATLKYVAPGSGGGTGSQLDPYLGLQQAANVSEPGDVFIVTDGTYTPVEVINSGEKDQPIIFRSENLHQAMIDGNDTDRGIVTLGVFDDSLQHIIIDGFNISNGNWAIDAQNTQFLTVRNNKITDVENGFVNRRENGWEHDQYITNNSIEGRTPWPQLNGEIAGERGIDIRGNNHTVSYNYISDFGDGISTDGAPYGISYSLDIHHNDINNMVDDLIEIDGTVSNTRVYQNRAFNGRMGVSLAPILGGPAYVFRNEFYNMETSAYKLNRSPAGIIICHNTSMKTGNGMSSDEGYQNTFLRNNIVMGSRYCFEEYGVVATSTDDWDYDAYYSSRSGSTGDEWFKWDNIRYANIAALNANTSLEQHGQEISLAYFVMASLPSSYAISYVPSDVNFSPTANASFINQGELLEQINSPFVIDNMPDMGALEFGQSLPHYGPDFDLLSDVTFVLSPDAISVYPNPTNQFLTISGSLDKYNLTILDAAGSTVKQIENVGNEQTVDLSFLGAGLYFIEISHMSKGSLCLKTMIKMP